MATVQNAIPAEIQQITPAKPATITAKWTTSTKKKITTHIIVWPAMLMGKNMIKWRM